MNKRILWFAAAVFAVALIVGLIAGFSGPKVTAAVTQDTKYGSATVALSQEEFEAVGFRLGDSCDITFSNGYTLKDVPYFNGYYVKTGAPVLVAYPGFANIAVTYNNAGIWDAAALAEGDTVTIRLHKAGKYSAIQEALGQSYSFDFREYDSAEQFCNFRALTGGALKPDFLFRGASPVDNSRGRAAYTDALLKAAGIAFVMDLADTEEDFAGYAATPDFASPYTAGLHSRGRVALLGMGSSYGSAEYQQQVAAGARAMMAASGPVYIHCMEGKDRTGFVCVLLEALAGATYEEMRADYMMTYGNYYRVYPDLTPEKYDAIAVLYFDAFMEYLHGTADLSVLRTADYAQDAAAYLMAGGLSAAEVEQLRAFICA